jgi:hypothetical protein
LIMIKKKGVGPAFAALCALQDWRM